MQIAVRKRVVFFADKSGLPSSGSAPALFGNLNPVDLSRTRRLLQIEGNVPHAAVDVEKSFSGPRCVAKSLAALRMRPEDEGSSYGWHS